MRRGAVRLLLVVSCWLVAAGSLSCAAATPELRIVENGSTQLGERGVGLGAFENKPRFRNGKRITVLYATLYVKSHGTVTKQQVALGDDLLIGRERWWVIELVEGSASTSGHIVLRKDE